MSTLKVKYAIIDYDFPSYWIIAVQISQSVRVFFGEYAMKWSWLNILNMFKPLFLDFSLTTKNSELPHSLLSFERSFYCAQEPFNVFFSHDKRRFHIVACKAYWYDIRIRTTRCKYVDKRKQDFSRFLLNFYRKIITHKNFEVSQ